MQFDMLSADLNQVSHTVALGSLILCADGFTMEEERPYDHLRMWDGSWKSIPLGKKPCRLELRFRMPAAAEGELLSVLRAALKNKTAFSFTLADTAFSDMQLTAFSLRSEPDAAFCHGILTFFGTAADPAAD